MKKNHYSKYQILNSPDQFKHLTKFYKIISVLWGVNDGLDEFYINIAPISQSIEAALQMSDEEFSSQRNEFMRLCICIKGVSVGFSSPKPYQFFFEWFYPTYFEVIKKGFKCFSEDGQVIGSLCELMSELLDTRQSRNKLETSTMTGFLLFQEISGLLLEFFEYKQMFTNYVPRKDKYNEKYQFIHHAIVIFHHCITGQFVNFAVCEYYKDMQFVNFSKLIFQLISIQDFQEFSSFTIML